MFKEYKNKIKEAVGEMRMEMIISKSVYIICIGSDDIANTYSQTLFRKPQYDIPAYTNLLISYALDFIQVFCYTTNKTLSFCAFVCTF